MVLGALSGILAYATVVKGKMTTDTTPSSTSWFPATPAYKLPGDKGVNRDKHPDPNKYGYASVVRNNRMWVPKILEKDLVSMVRKWPVNNPTHKALMEEILLRGQLNKPWGDSTWLLKSPLFCANNRRFGPRIQSRVPSLTVGSLKDGSRFILTKGNYTDFEVSGPPNVGV